MTLSIITINRNNASGLEKTLMSVASQSVNDIEHIIIDGASHDGSIDVIKKYAADKGEMVKWISESDEGIYNAMNKGIKMATGDYVQFLNSGDSLAGQDVTKQVLYSLKEKRNPPILYGNLLKIKHDGSIFRDKGPAGKGLTLLDFYLGTLNHSSSYIHSSLFNKYGLYDEGYKIVSDWKWFLNVIVFGRETPEYIDFDIAYFNMDGVSTNNLKLNKEERDIVLHEMLNPAILSDYEQWSASIMQMKRIQRHPWAYRIVHIIERCLFKIEKQR